MPLENYKLGDISPDSLHKLEVHNSVEAIPTPTLYEGSAISDTGLSAMYSLALSVYGSQTITACDSFHKRHQHNPNIYSGYFASDQTKCFAFVSLVPLYPNAFNKKMKEGYAYKITLDDMDRCSTKGFSYLLISSMVVHPELRSRALATSNLAYRIIERIPARIQSYMRDGVFFSEMCGDAITKVGQKILANLGLEAYRTDGEVISFKGKLIPPEVTPRFKPMRQLVNAYKTSLQAITNS